MRSLLTSAMGVCRQWRDLIRTSPSLRRALYFESDKRAADDPHRPPVYNPLLVELFRPLFNKTANLSKRPGIDDLAIEALPIGRRTRAFYRRNASWRRMHVRQPPVEHVGFWVCTGGMFWSCTATMVIYPAGLRMEGLYFWALKYSYGWQESCLISWTAKQRQTLWQISVEKTLRKRAEEMSRMADVIFTAHFYADCMYEDDERKKYDPNGLVTIGKRWFKMKQDGDWATEWEEEDSGLYD
ncbi:hypothetical protein N0V93_009189 [Gnomoniopsis smithogilvyi]|uniref:F-box domain-containing protein n=1 Tax=Gnomoniopsis smithogilvyi TaxID=1191159 RepID=A0A9W8YKM8_9PEZI|nr:hypothetical protein N0V93_009189 [Gnomoniopsis smithogilvyi]